MTDYPAWMPAPRPGIVPLHPFGFGTTLGRSFSALRQNPAVLLGFALGVQALAYLVLLVAVGAVAVASFTRLDTLTPGTEDFQAVLAGSIALTAITGIVLGLAAGALGVLVQGIVVSEVAAAVVAEKRTLGDLWRRVRPVAWRLIGYAALLSAAAILAIALLAAALFALGSVALPAAIAIGILLVLGAIPLVLWLNTKLLLVPAVIILERAPIRAAIGRSWRLTRTRFWPTLGILVIISFTFGVIGQIVGIPLQFVSMGLTTVISPTGDPDVGALIAVLVIALITQVLTILVQCVALIVQSTAAALIYVDCRMRHEGLDLDLSAYVDARDAGRQDLPDPYLAHIGRVLPPRAPASVAGYAPPAYPPPPYGMPPMPPTAAPAYPPSPYGMPPTPPPASPAPLPPAPPAAPAPERTTWAAPGSPDSAGRA
ncbi:glycerophosphoryl diester phosphodiesterase membrane domain-containing protein [Microbacterium sp. RD1]|uniref:glycerophosphoryl diester phosphodiesterase membrane domain-containing protein n=1 Tax=Microbacterium sp. RD1 TaxID=3457313 RepID=UPI003FA5C316